MTVHMRLHRLALTLLCVWCHPLVCIGEDLMMEPPDGDAAAATTTTTTATSTSTTTNMPYDHPALRFQFQFGNFANSNPGQQQPAYTDVETMVCDALWFVTRILHQVVGRNDFGMNAVDVLYGYTPGISFPFQLSFTGRLYPRAVGTVRTVEELPLVNSTTAELVRQGMDIRDFLADHVWRATAGSSSSYFQQANDVTYQVGVIHGPLPYVPQNQATCTLLQWPPITYWSVGAALGPSALLHDDTAAVLLLIENTRQPPTPQFVQSLVCPTNALILHQLRTQLADPGIVSQPISIEWSLMLNNNNNNNLPYHNNPQQQQRAPPSLVITLSIRAVFANGFVVPMGVLMNVLDTSLESLWEFMGDGPLAYEQDAGTEPRTAHGVLETVDCTVIDGGGTGMLPPPNGLGGNVTERQELNLKLFVRNEQEQKAASLVLDNEPLKEAYEQFLQEVVENTTVLFPAVSIVLEDSELKGASSVPCTSGGVPDLTCFRVDGAYEASITAPENAMATLGAAVENNADLALQRGRFQELLKAIDPNNPYWVGGQAQMMQLSSPQTDNNPSPAPATNSGMNLTWWMFLIPIAGLLLIGCLAGTIAWLCFAKKKTPLKELPATAQTMPPAEQGAGAGAGALVPFTSQGEGALVPAQEQALVPASEAPAPVPQITIDKKQQQEDIYPDMDSTEKFHTVVLNDDDEVSELQESNRDHFENLLEQGSSSTPSGSIGEFIVIPDSGASHVSSIGGFEQHQVIPPTTPQTPITSPQTTITSPGGRSRPGRTTSGGSRNSAGSRHRTSVKYDSQRDTWRPTMPETIVEDASESRSKSTSTGTPRR